MPSASIRATQRLLTDRYVWPGIKADSRKWTRTCLKCQKSKVQCHTVTPLSTFATPDARFDRVHIDIVGPLPPSQGFSYLLTCMDRFTRWPEVVNITAETVASTFVSGWIARFGIPSIITTDRGHQFESALWEQMTRLLGIQQIHTTPLPIGWWNASTDSSKPLSKLTLLQNVTPHGVTRGTQCNQRGPPLHNCRAGIRHNSPPPWRIFHLIMRTG